MHTSQTSPLNSNVDSFSFNLLSKKADADLIVKNNGYTARTDTKANDTKLSGSQLEIQVVHSNDNYGTVTNALNYGHGLAVLGIFTELVNDEDCSRTTAHTSASPSLIFRTVITPRPKYLALNLKMSKQYAYKLVVNCFNVVCQKSELLKRQINV